MGLWGKAAFAIVFAAALGLFARAVYQRYRILRIGKPEQRFARPLERVKSLLVYVLGQKKVLAEPYPGVMHLFIFWGFLVLGLGEVQLLGEGLFEGFSVPLIGKSPLFYMVQDLFAVLVLIGVAMAAWRRYVIKPDRLEKNAEAAVILILITGVIITLFAIGGLKGALDGSGQLHLALVVGPLAGWIAGLGWDPGMLKTLYHIFWWTHVLIILGFLVFIPYSKHLHLLASPFNVYFRSLAPMGQMLKPIDFTIDQEVLGVNQVEGFTWKQLLDCYSCAQCGRCQDNCPAYLSGRPLSPKKLIDKLKNHLIEHGQMLVQPSGNDMPSAGDKVLIGDIFTEKEIWSCTTCGACQYNCPVFNEHVPKIVDLRRFLSMEESAYPAGVDHAVRSLESRGHPYRGNSNSRGSWFKKTWIEEAAGKEGVEVLYWVGCTTALDERNMKTAQAFAELLRKARVNFTILGEEERCCGDPARRLGNEYLYQNLVSGNIEALHDSGAKTIVTTCPHCYSVFKNDYPQFGGDFIVYHHTEYLWRLLREQKLKVAGGCAETVTYHDPCYLGRYNEIFEAPREILKALAGLRLVEMESNRGKSFCCGGGGGGAWMEDAGNARINYLRAKQAQTTVASVLCTACPFCMTMMNDGIKTNQAGPGEVIKVLDIAEILAAAMEQQDS
ncbi:MAG: heterodisulfide reductase-related iron-sulfur binding cluster [Desulfobaccales bacterium]